jgi:hypothetical protein
VVEAQLQRQRVAGEGALDRLLDQRRGLPDKQLLGEDRRAIAPCRRPAGLPDRLFSNRSRAARLTCFCWESTGIATLHPLTASGLRRDFGQEYRMRL